MAENFETGCDAELIQRPSKDLVAVRMAPVVDRRNSRRVRKPKPKKPGAFGIEDRQIAERGILQQFFDSLLLPPARSAPFGGDLEDKGLPGLLCCPEGTCRERVSVCRPSARHPEQDHDYATSTVQYDDQISWRL